MNFTEAKDWVKSQPKKYLCIAGSVIAFLFGLLVGGLW